MALTPQDFDALCERDGVQAGAERDFLDGLNRRNRLTVDNFSLVFEAYGAGSRDHYDASLEDPPVVPRRTGSQVPQVTTRLGEVTAPDRERAQALSRHLARLATASDSVRMFRKSLFGTPTGVLATGLARKLLLSPAIRCMRWHDLRALGVPLDGTHTAHEDRSSGAPEETITIRWPGRRRALVVKQPYTTRQVLISLPDEIGQVGQVHAEPQSFLDVLSGPWGHAYLLASSHGWTIPQATWFLLTGRVPVIEPLSVKTELFFSELGPTAAWISIRLLPHVSPESVIAALAQEHNRLVGHGYSRRPIEARNLALVDFVEGQIASRARQADFARLLPLWNTKHPEWRFRFPSKMESQYRATAYRVFMLELLQKKLAPDPGSPRERLNARCQQLSDRPKVPSFFLDDAK